MLRICVATAAMLLLGVGPYQATAGATAPHAIARPASTPVHTDTHPHLLIRQRGGHYAPGSLSRLPRSEANQVCLAYNNYWCLKGTRWEGQVRVGKQRLAVFDNGTQAARAVALTLQAYRFKHGLRTPRQVMTRYVLSAECRKGGRAAPGCETMWQKVDRYAARIGQALGIRPDDPMGVFKARNVVDRQRAHTLFREMAHIEVGDSVRVREEVLDEGLRRAGIVAA